MLAGDKAPIFAQFHCGLHCSNPPLLLRSTAAAAIHPGNSWRSLEPPNSITAVTDQPLLKSEVMWQIEEVDHRHPYWIYHSRGWS
ncbi:unnamed protein product [Cuscuta campestris]|uniref:Uncharacterized protein n=1 Tax=Cuscuta campestris TaxID=132261 RepID=A0A484K899_9ASTE|nr:unnamed protein product [Cuscuta campestris]